MNVVITVFIQIFMFSMCGPPIAKIETLRKFEFVLVRTVANPGAAKFNTRKCLSAATFTLTQENITKQIRVQMW